MTYARKKHSSLWWREPNIAGAFSLFDITDTAMGDISVGGIAGKTDVWGTNEFDKPVKLYSTNDTPTDGSTVDILYRMTLDQRHRLYKMLEQKGGVLYLQRRLYSCPPLNKLNTWKQLQHCRITLTGGTIAASRNLESDDGTFDNTNNFSLDDEVTVFVPTLSSLTSGTALAVYSVAGLDEDNDCIPGYPGKDRIIFAGLAQNTAPAEIYASTNGGSSWAAITTDPTPFAVNSNITGLIAQIVDEDSARLVAFRAGDAGTKAQFAYADVSVNATTITAASWTLTTVAATSNNDAFEAALWPQELGRGYFCTAGDIYLTTDSWATDPGAAIYTGSNAFAAMAKYNNDIWAVGAANTIVVERSNNRSTFAARTGPSGGGAFTSIDFADDGTMFAGNGTALYKSNDEAGGTGGWTSLKDFGASHKVIKTVCENGSSIILTVYVDDTTPSAGEVWKSEDGGNSWNQVTESVNTGYNSVYVMADTRTSIIGGDGGTIELMS